MVFFFFFCLKSTLFISICLDIEKGKATEELESTIRRKKPSNRLGVTHEILII
ncbi:hypothetical protein CIPAW_08G121900 [Carya illinoinensis]|uniref:Ribosomal protein S15 n=1 Tax=Carya illinoinensis TaxID=32201 RepID=A0A8T1PUW2_CARIL|nr:hypothetical protein CIPAW_08G121900 [Carya illinoinensis]